MELDFDLYSTVEIHRMIANGTVSEQEVVNFYGNEWWDYTPTKTNES